MGRVVREVAKKHEVAEQAPSEKSGEAKQQATLQSDASPWPEPAKAIAAASAQTAAGGAHNWSQ